MEPDGMLDDLGGKAEAPTGLDDVVMLAGLPRRQRARQPDNAIEEAGLDVTDQQYQQAAIQLSALPCRKLLRRVIYGAVMTAKPIDLLVGARLRRLREAQAMALSDVGLAIGASAAHIEEYASGARRGPADNLLAVAGSSASD
jgi:hypothetical protein